MMLLLLLWFLWGSSFATTLYSHPLFTLRGFVLPTGSLEVHLLLAKACNLKRKHYSSLPLCWAHLSERLVYVMNSDILSKYCLNILAFVDEVSTDVASSTVESKHWEESVYIRKACECAFVAQIFILTPTPSSSSVGILCFYLRFCQSNLPGLFFPASSSFNKQSQIHCHTVHTVLIRHCLAQQPLNVNTRAYVILIFHSLETSRPAIQT